MKSQANLLGAIGRILIAALFIFSAYGKISAPEATQGYIASVGLPFPLLSYLVAIIVELGGGILLLIGYQTRSTSIVLAAFTVVTALVFHIDFGDQNQMANFLKNFAVAGGLLQMAAFGAVSVSLDARRLRAA